MLRVQKKEWVPLELKLQAAGLRNKLRSSVRSVIVFEQSLQLPIVLKIHLPFTSVYGVCLSM